MAVDFQLCRELDVSCNKLEALPPELSKCQRLRKLKGNGNYLKTIPEGLGDCCLLEVSEALGIHVGRSILRQINLTIARTGFQRRISTILQGTQAL